MVFRKVKSTHAKLQRGGGLFLWIIFSTKILIIFRGKKGGWVCGKIGKKKPWYWVVNPPFFFFPPPPHFPALNVATQETCRSGNLLKCTSSNFCWPNDHFLKSCKLNEQFYINIFCVNTILRNYSHLRTWFLEKSSYSKPLPEGNWLNWSEGSCTEKKSNITQKINNLKQEEDNLRFVNFQKW